MNDNQTLEKYVLNELKEQILSFMQKPGFQKKTASKLLPQLMEDNAENFVKLMKALNQLEDEYLILHDDKGRYGLLEHFGYAHGTIMLKESGYGFATTKQHESDIFIPRDKTKGALTGDEVLIKCNFADPKGPSGEVERITERKNTHLYGIVRKKGKHYFVMPEDYRFNVAIFVKPENLLGAKEGDMVKVFISKYYEDGRLDGEVVTVIGPEEAPGVDITAVIMSAGVRTEFGADVLREAKEYGNTIPERELEGRRDLRNKQIVTIDGIDAKDFDDAVGLEELPNGNYHLGVYIADVSFYVREGSAIDQEAFLRSFSIYLPDRVYPMLPEVLSNGLCSLRPNEDRLVLGCEMEVTKAGKVISYDIFPGVIRSNARLTYTAVNELFQKGSSDTIPASLHEMLFKMNDLAKTLHNIRFERGALDFDVTEAKVILNEFGRVSDIVVREREDAEKLIEEFMILTNETVAQAMAWHEAPFIYRVHETPKEEKITQFKAISKLLGYNIPEKAPLHVKTLQRVMDQTKNEPFGTLLHNLLLRSMAKAKYDGVNIGHYGLASACYTHFTSPIRRYPDLIAHRLVKKYFFKGDTTSTEADELNVTASAITSSKQERVIERIERDVLDMKKCEYMENYVGANFEGVISSVVPWGFYVELPNTIEGLVGVDNIGPDQYTFMEDLLEWHGKHSNRRFRIGDQVKVTLLSASKIKRQIDFAIR